MRISVTERGNFKRCKRLWGYTSFNHMALTPIAHSPALDTGTLVHKALADWTQDESVDPQAALITHSADMLQKIEDNYRKTVGMRMSGVEKNVLYDSMTLAHNMVGNYVAKWKTPLPAHFKLIEPEQMCIINIPGVPDNWHCKECNYRWWRQYQPGTRKLYEIEFCDKCKSMETELEKAELEGTLDGFVIDAKESLYVLERKTYANRPRLETLQMTDQFLAYVWILTQLFPNRKIGGLLYDGLWKRDNKPLDECFMRHLIDRPPYEVDGFLPMLQAEYRDMLNTNVFYPNRNWMGCVDCKGFNSLCTAESRGEDMQWLLEENYTTRERDGVILNDDDE